MNLPHTTAGRTTARRSSIYQSCLSATSVCLQDGQPSWYQRAFRLSQSIQIRSKTIPVSHSSIRSNYGRTGSYNDMMATVSFRWQRNMPCPAATIKSRTTAGDPSLSHLPRYMHCSIKAVAYSPVPLYLPFCDLWLEMMCAHRALALAVLVGSSAAKQCTNMTVPVTISARNGIFDIAIPQTNLDATTFIQNLTRQGQNFSEVALSGYATTSGTYNISAQFCVPSAGNVSNPTVQVLTHGVGFDKTWEGVRSLFEKSTNVWLGTGTSRTTTSIIVMLMSQPTLINTAPCRMIAWGLVIRRMANLSTRSKLSWR